MSGETSPECFRRVLGHYPTGVSVVTSIDDEGRPLGMSVGSFTSASLDPPLVAFLPDKKSATWPRIQSIGRFCVNVLSHRQTAVCRAFASKEEDRFSACVHERSPAGMPRLGGVVAWIDCSLEAVHEAGDHWIVLGRVTALDLLEPAPPLIFFQGGFGAFGPLT